MTVGSGASFTFPRYEIDEEAVTNLRAIARKVEEFRPSLGIPILGALAARIGARYSTLGRGVIFTAEKGEGKGEIIEATNQRKVSDIWEASNFLGKRFIKAAIKAARKEGRDMSNVSIVFEDLAMAAEDKYRLNNTLHLASWLVSNKKYSDKTDFEKGFDEDGGAYDFNSVSFIAGATPRTVSSIMKRRAWRDMWSDRLSRFALLTRPEDLYRIDRYESKGRDVSAQDLRRIVGKMIPELPDRVELEVSQDEIKEVDRLLFTDQHGIRRGRKYVANDLRGLAALQGDDVATSDHLGVLRLLAPYYQVGSLHPRDMLIVQIAINNQPYWNIRAISKRTGLSDMWWIRQRVLEAAKYDLLDIRFDSSNIGKTAISAGERLRLAFESIDTFLADP